MYTRGGASFLAWPPAIVCGGAGGGGFSGCLAFVVHAAWQLMSGQHLCLNAAALTPAVAMTMPKEARRFVGPHKQQICC